MRTTTGETPMGVASENQPPARPRQEDHSMPRPSSEALLIAALINSGDVAQAAAYGVHPDMLVGYQAEYRWLLSYNATYGSCPSWEALSAKFSDFPITDHRDAAFAADEVRYAADHRMLRSAIRTAASCVAEGDYEEAAMAMASYRPIQAVKPQQNSLSDSGFLDTYHEKPAAIALPWKTLQNLTGGIRAGDLWYVAARLGQGKTWSVIDIACHALMLGHRVNLFSLEMPKSQIMTRVHVNLGFRLGEAVDHIAMRDKIYDVITYRKLIGKIHDEVPGELFVFDGTDGRVSPTTVGAYACDVDLNIIDYTGLMASTSGKRAVDDWRVMASISNELKEVATSKSTRIIALSQINREGDTIGKYPPKTKNLAQSDSLGQDGDVVLTHKKYARTAQIFSLEKNRHGVDQRYFYTRFLPNEGKFSEISKEVADDLRETDQDDDAA